MDFLRSAVAAGLALHLAAGPEFAATAGPAIGAVVTSGAFRLNHATVRSNATVFEGAMVETGATPARMDLTSGVRLELESESAGRVFDGHLLLERGAARIGRAVRFTAGSAGVAAAFLIEARGLTIQPDTSATTSRIVLIGAQQVEVATLTGSVRVLNSGGMLVAKIAAGRALALEPRSTPGPSRITGRLVTRAGRFLLTDETTNVTVEVAGSASTKADLPRALGQRVEVTGLERTRAAAVSGAVQLVEIAQVTPAPAPTGSAPAGSGGTAGTAPAGAGGPAAAGAGSAGGAAGGATISVTMIAVIGGVAAAAVVGGLAASGGLGGSTATPVSR